MGKILKTPAGKIIKNGTDIVTAEVAQVEVVNTTKAEDEEAGKDD